MIVSPGRGYVFVHAPKTGGTAMTLALEARAKADDIIVADTPKGRRRRHRLQGVKTAGRLWKHSKLSDITGILPPEDLARLVPVTLVRNPWDRVVSYYHWLRAQTFNHPSVHAAQRLAFAAFVADEGVARGLRANPYAAYVAGGRPPIFIRLEHLDTDLAPFEELLGFRLTLDRVNASERQADWRPYYDDDSRARVAEICADDIARFGYTF